MTFRTQNTIRLLAVTAALIAGAPAQAALLDRGPQDPTLVFPQWYRALDGTAVGLCLAQDASPNAAGGKPMCFPLVNDPNGFAGNIGPEVFYNNLNVLIGKGAAAGGANTFALRYIAGLEASYLPLGVPVHGTETVFARVRVVINAQCLGRYTVTHPFGFEVFDVTDTGPRAVFFTADVPLAAPMNFDGALNGRIGPFIEWDFIDAGMSLTVAGKQFLGDPNLNHTFKGSPFATNYVEVQAAGCDLGNGIGVAVREITGAVSGQRWLAPIATAFKVDRSVYSTSTVTGLNTVDVWASSAPLQKLILTGLDMPSLQLLEYGPGFYYGHIEYSAAKPPPSSVTVTNLSSNPVSTLDSSLADQVDAVASFDPLTGILTVNASTSDLTLTGDKLTAESPAFPAAKMTVGATPGTATYSTTLLATVEPPKNVRVVSTAGGVGIADLAVGSGKPMNQPGVATAVSDGSPIAPIVLGPPTIPGPPYFLSPLQNDLNFGTLPFTGSILVITQPLNGTASANPDGTVLYTPKVGSQGADSFTYAIQTAAGVSNVATIYVSVPLTLQPPTANADNFAMQQGLSRTIDVTANDTAPAGTDIVNATPIVTIVTRPANGTVTVTGRNVTYTPRIGFNSAFDSFTYTIAPASNPTLVSAPGTVTVEVFGGPEAVSVGKATYTASRAKWVIVGNTNWFNAALTQTTATCYLVSTAGAAIPAPGRLIGTTPVDGTGKFQLAPVGPVPAATSPATVRCTTSNGGTSPAAPVSIN
jgi:hypothetical protein